MTHVDDLYEPGDDREPEPDEGGEQPLDLAEVEDAYKVVFPKVAWLGSSGERLVEAIPRLIAELSEARQRISEWEALPTREEWTVTPRRDITPAQHDPLMRSFDSGDLTAETAARNGWQLWRQRSSLHPWEPISTKSPF